MKVKKKTFPDKLKSERIYCFEKEEKLEGTYFSISTLTTKQL